MHSSFDLTDQIHAEIIFIVFINLQNITSVGHKLRLIFFHRAYNSLVLQKQDKEIQLQQMQNENLKKRQE